MTCQSARERFPDLLDRRVPAAEKEVRAHLQSCPDCARDFSTLLQTATALDALPTPAPSARLGQDFRLMLEREKQVAADDAAARPLPPARSRRARWTWLLSPLAGCALLVLGFVAGQRFGPAPDISTTVTPSSADSTHRELAALREQLNEQRQQIDRMTTLVGYSILQQQQNPANERLQDVLTAARAENVNDKTLDDLIQAVTLDPSANVRLRAIEALYPHAERATVRAGVLAALPRESNPLVQLELIDFVASAQVRSATPVLERISADDTANVAVRDAARLALAQL